MFYVPFCGWVVTIKSGMTEGFGGIMPRTLHPLVLVHVRVVRIEKIFALSTCIGFYIIMSSKLLKPTNTKSPSELCTIHSRQCGYHVFGPIAPSYTHPPSSTLRYPSGSANLNHLSSNVWPQLLFAEKIDFDFYKLSYNSNRAAIHHVTLSHG